MSSQEQAGCDGRSFRMSIPSSAAGAVHLRKQFIRFLEAAHPDASTIADIEVVIGEALANAAEHGHRPHGTIRIEAAIANGSLEAAVSDDGPGFFLRGPISAEQPPPHAPRGYGLFLIRTLVDELELRDDGKTVWFRKLLHEGRSENR